MFIQEPYSCNYKQNTKANTKQKYKNEILLLISCLYSYCFDQNHVLSHLLLPWLPEIRKWRCKDGGKCGSCHLLENKHKYIGIRSNQDILWQRCWWRSQSISIDAYHSDEMLRTFHFEWWWSLRWARWWSDYSRLLVIRGNHGSRWMGGGGGGWLGALGQSIWNNLDPFTIMGQYLSRHTLWWW